MTTPRTLVDVFRNLETLGKPDLLLHKKDGRWRPDLLRRVRGRT